jgi:uncharacterized membrane protein
LGLLLLLEPVLFAAVGAAAGAAGAGLSALGLNQWFLRQLDETLEPGRAALFVVVSDTKAAVVALTSVLEITPLLDQLAQDEPMYRRSLAATLRVGPRSCKVVATAVQAASSGGGAWRRHVKSGCSCWSPGA